MTNYDGLTPQEQIWQERYDKAHPKKDAMTNDTKTKHMPGPWDETEPKTQEARTGRER